MNLNKTVGGLPGALAMLAALGAYGAPLMGVPRAAVRPSAISREERRRRTKARKEAKRQRRKQ